jgi:hypothetical protein
VILAFTRKKDVLFQLKIRGASKKFKNQPRPLFMYFDEFSQNIIFAKIAYTFLKNYQILSAFENFSKG